MCSCTEPVRTGIGAVCVEYGRPKWPITMLNHTHIHRESCFVFLFWHPMLIRPVMKRLFFLGKPRIKGLASLARLMIIWVLWTIASLRICSQLRASSRALEMRREKKQQYIGSTSHQSSRKAWPCMYLQLN